MDEALYNAWKAWSDDQDACEECGGEGCGACEVEPDYEADIESDKAEAYLDRMGL